MKTIISIKIYGRYTHCLLFHQVFGKICNSLFKCPLKILYSTMCILFTSVESAFSQKCEKKGKIHFGEPDMITRKARLLDGVTGGIWLGKKDKA